MRRMHHLFLLLFITNNLFSQQPTQRGKVREINSNKKSLRGVLIKCFKSNSKESGQDGTFTLKFERSIKVGDRIAFDLIKKEGYIVTNEDQFNNLVFSADGNLTPDIIMAKRSYIETREGTIAKNAIKEIKREYNIVLDSLKKQLKFSKISVEFFQLQKTKLSENRDLKIERTKSSASYYARINKDDNNKLMNKALNLYESGKVDQANKVFEEAKIDKKLKDATNEKTHKESEIKKGFDNMIASATGNVIKYPDRAVNIITEMLNSSENDLDALNLAANFYDEHYFSQHAIQNYSKITVHLESSEKQKANAHSSIGRLYFSLGNINKAKEHFDEFHRVSKLLYNMDSLSSSKNNLAISHKLIGDVNISIGNLDNALNSYLKYNSQAKELHLADLENKGHRYILASSFEKLGNIYNTTGNLKEAAIFYQENNKLAKELNLADSENFEFKKLLAISYGNLGDTYRSAGNLEKAIELYENYNHIVKDFRKNNKINAEIDNLLAISYEKLGNAYYDLGDLKQALAMYQKYNRIEEELSLDLPDVIKFKYRLAISYERIGTTQKKLENPENTLTAFDTYNKLAKNLYKTYPNHVDFKNILAISNIRLAEMYLSNDKEKATTYLKKSSQLYNELLSLSPSNNEYKRNQNLVSSKLKLIKEQ